MEYVIETKNLSKKFSTKLAANNVNMHIEKGSIYGFIGKNGAGKTTVMKLILGLLRPTGGEIKINGSSDLMKERAKIGSLIEDPGIYKNCTAIENMKRYAILFNTSDDEIRELLKLVDLDKTGPKVAGHFSLGMKQRLGIAISLLGHPDILVLDEPINGLDPAGIKEVRDTILRLNKEKGFEVFSEHAPVVVEQIVPVDREQIEHVVQLDRHVLEVVEHVVGHAVVGDDGLKGLYLAEVYVRDVVEVVLDVVVDDVEYRLLAILDVEDMVEILPEIAFGGLCKSLEDPVIEIPVADGVQKIPAEREIIGFRLNLEIFVI